ncbi:NUDIX hydrolase [Roseococcus sp. SYP-B2431]|uniref:NUDIX hydrolase n=1 Tax=Roseococcus sp. SYP-B2431 TaxID=2496640 RepID=UPI001040781B|nr:NUDIX hydrolase [Roseococcus sp. SYP-B2431]TCH98320.1 NUDIX hydrolase [Roseococcus sp. SYP-B2431]
MPSPAKADVAQQFAAIPLRDAGEGMEVLLITSRRTHRWVLPKGWAEDGLTGRELAAKEAFEEAGLIGRMSASAIGSYGYQKMLADGRQRRCNVTVFRMTVERELPHWPEHMQRQRQWFRLPAAASLVDEPDLAALLRLTVAAS